MLLKSLFSWNRQHSTLPVRSFYQTILSNHSCPQSCTYGGRRITHKISRESEKLVNHKRIERIMRENGIRSKSHKKYKATTNSRHNLPVAENILNRSFDTDRLGQKMVSDITYIPTGEGWLILLFNLLKSFCKENGYPNCKNAVCYHSCENTKPL